MHLLHDHRELMTRAREIVLRYRRHYEITDHTTVCSLLPDHLGIASILRLALTCWSRRVSARVLSPTQHVATTPGP
jgi:hypothetical protein